jgi:hypothetical protein
MKEPANPAYSSPAPVTAPAPAFLVALLLGAAAPLLPAQSFDFNTGTDTGWTHYSLPAVWAATYSFPADDTGGKAYKIFAPPTNPDPFGLKNARAGSYRPDANFSARFSVGADLLAWNDAWHQEAGVLFYFQDINLGTSDGYTATYSSAYKNLYISSINNEVGTTVGKLPDGSIQPDPTHRYRLVASSHDGFTLLLQLFDKSEPNAPWVSVIAQDSTYTAGRCGLFVFEQNYPSATEGAEATFDNYLATTPPTGGMPATITDLSPPPAGKATVVYPTVSVNILDRDTTVDTTSIVISLDGVWIPNTSLIIDPQVHKTSNPTTYPRDFAGATVSYPITSLLPWGSRHTNQVAFRDSASTWQTNTWSWTIAYPYLFASNSLPVGSLSVRGFDVRMVQSENGGTNLDNSLDRARQQLAIPPQIPVNRTATSIVQVLNWNETGTPENVPGLCPGNYINIAVEATAYLELTAGMHRFRVDSDDRLGLYSGRNLADTTSLPVWENPGATANTTFEFGVEAAGLYPVRCLWEETAGGAHLYLHSVDLNDASETLINDPTDSPGVVRAWYPIVCKSSPLMAGPFTIAATALNALNRVEIIGTDCGSTTVGERVTGGTFTIPITSAAHFYYLDGPRKTRITNISSGAGNVMIDYQIQ